MAKEVSIDTPMDDKFKFNAENVKFLVDNIRYNSVSITQPIACGAYHSGSHYLCIEPVFFAVPTDWRVHFELNNNNKEGVCLWQLHFEATRNISLDEDLKQVRKVMETSLATMGIRAVFMSLFPVDQESDRYEWRDGWCGDKSILHFKTDHAIKTIGDALEVFDDFYSYVIDVLNQADMKQLKKQYPEAAEFCKLYSYVAKADRL